MIITDRFVFIHLPKTGGHFVREVLDRAARRESQGVLRRAGIFAPRFGLTETGDYHATCHDIPAAHRHKPILAAVRDPFDYYVSQYRFGWWASHPEDYRDFAAVRRAFPNFPDLSFDEYLDLASRFFPEFKDLGDESDDPKLGYYSAVLIQTFFRRPREAYEAIDADYLAERRWEQDAFPAHFLSTERLNADLYDYARRAGYPHRYIADSLVKAPVRPKNGSFDLKPKTTYKSHYSEAAYEFVRHKERLIFAMFDHLDGERPYSEWLGED